MQQVEIKVNENAHVFASQTLTHSSAEAIAQTIFRMVCTPAHHQSCHVRVLDSSGAVVAQVPTIQLMAEEHNRYSISTFRFIFAHNEFDPPLRSEIIIRPSIKNWLFWLGVGSIVGMLFLSLALLVLFLVDRERMRHQLERAKLALQAQEARAALGGMATQVAHDIRSPLAALDSVLSVSSQLPEDKRIMIRSAIGRIRDIANNLIEKNREIKSTATEPNTETPATQEKSSTRLLSSLVEPLITEKRMQYRSKIGIEIDGRLDAASYGLFASIQPTEFKRMLSLLLRIMARGFRRRFWRG